MSGVVAFAVRGARRLAQVSADERAVTLTALGLLPVVALALRAAGMARAQSAAELLAWNARAAPRTVAAARVSVLVDAVADGLGSGGVRVTCLARALTLCALLARRGERPELKLGVRKTSERELDAHAWVELEGEALSARDEGESGYEPLAPA